MTTGEIGPQARRPGWTVLAWLVALLPHALPVWWIAELARTLPEGQRPAIQLVACYEVGIAVAEVVVASAFTGRLAWLGRIGRLAAVIGAVVMVPAALLAGMR